MQQNKEKKGSEYRRSTMSQPTKVAELEKDAAQIIAYIKSCLYQYQEKKDNSTFFRNLRENQFSRGNHQ